MQQQRILAEVSVEQIVLGDSLSTRGSLVDILERHRPDGRTVTLGSVAGRRPFLVFSLRVRLGDRGVRLGRSLTLGRCRRGGLC